MIVQQFLAPQQASISLDPMLRAATALCERSGLFVLNQSLVLTLFGRTKYFNDASHMQNNDALHHTKGKYNFRICRNYVMKNGSFC